MGETEIASFFFFFKNPKLASIFQASLELT